MDYQFVVLGFGGGRDVAILVLLDVSNGGDDNLEFVVVADFLVVFIPEVEHVLLVVAAENAGEATHVDVVEVVPLLLTPPFVGTHLTWVPLQPLVVLGSALFVAPQRGVALERVFGREDVGVFSIFQGRLLGLSGVDVEGEGAVRGSGFVLLVLLAGHVDVVEGVTLHAPLESLDHVTAVAQLRFTVVVEEVLLEFF